MCSVVNSRCSHITESIRPGQRKGEQGRGEEKKWTTCWSSGLDGEIEECLSLPDSGREREREREFFFKANPLAFTEGLYEAQSLHVSALKLQIPPRFVDRMVVS